MTDRAVTYTDEAAWLSAKQKILSATDIVKVLGQNGQYGPLSLYTDKILGRLPADEKIYLAYGRDIEGATGNALNFLTGRRIEDLGKYTISYHPDIPWIGATLDRVLWGNDEHPSPADGRGPAELKSVNRFDIRTDDWDADPPLMYQIQLQIQMACADADWGCLAGMFPGYDLRWKDFERNAKFLDAAMPAIEDFWRRVQDKDPPPPEGPRCLDAVKRLYSAESGETVALDAAMLELADKWEIAKAAGREAEAVKKECEAKLRAEIGSATFGDLGDGTLLVRSTSVVRAHTRAESTRHLLRRTRPKNM